MMNRKSGRKVAFTVRAVPEVERYLVEIEKANPQLSRNAIVNGILLDRIKAEAVGAKR